VKEFVWRLAVVVAIIGGAYIVAVVSRDCPDCPETPSLQILTRAQETGEYKWIGVDSMIADWQDSIARLNIMVSALGDAHDRFWKDSIAKLNEIIADTGRYEASCCWAHWPHWHKAGNWIKPDPKYGGDDWAQPCIPIAAVDSFVRSHINVEACDCDSLSWFCRFNGYDWQQLTEKWRR